MQELHISTFIMKILNVDLIVQIYMLGVNFEDFGNIG